LITRPDDQFISWNLHWSGFLVGLLVAVALCPFLWFVSPAWDAVELTLQG
jgi:CDP-diglyceride synthetase